MKEPNRYTGEYRGIQFTGVTEGTKCGACGDVTQNVRMHIILRHTWPFKRW